MSVRVDIQSKEEGREGNHLHVLFPSLAESCYVYIV